MGYTDDIFGGNAGAPYPDAETELEKTPALRNDYTLELDPVNALKDPRVIEDIFQHYKQHGELYKFNSVEDMINEFVEDKRWQQNNVVSATVGTNSFGFSKSRNYNEDQKGREARLDNVWNMLPNITDPRFREAHSYSNAPVKEFWKDYAASALLDPTNLIPTASGAKAAATATRAGAGAGKALMSGAARGALTEGAVAGGQEFLIDAGEQGRRKELGLQEEYDIGRGAMATGAGFGIGAVTGGIMGTIGGAWGRRKASKPINEVKDALSKITGRSPDSYVDIPENDLRRMLVEAATELEDSAAAKLIEEEEAAVSASADDDSSSNAAVLEKHINDASIYYDELQTRLSEGDESVTQEDVAALRDLIVQYRELRQLNERIEAGKTEINTRRETTDLTSLSEAQRRDAALFDAESLMRRIIEDPDAESIARLRETVEQATPQKIDAEKAAEGSDTSQTPNTPEQEPTQEVIPPEETPQTELPSRSINYGRAGSGNVMFPDEAHAALYDHATARRPSLDSSGKARIAKELGVNPSSIDQISKDYVKRVRAAAKSSIGKEEPYNAQSFKPVEDDVSPAAEELLEKILTKAYELDADSLYNREVIKKLASSDVDSAGIVDDIMELYDSSMNSLLDVDNSARAFTSSENKRIRQLAKNKMENNADLDRASALEEAKMQLMLEKKLGRTLKDSKSQLTKRGSTTARAGDTLATGPTTAGVSPTTGRIQDILKRGRYVGKDRTITEGARPTSSRFNLEEAKAKANIGKSKRVEDPETGKTRWVTEKPQVVEFEGQGGERLADRPDTPLKQGEVAYYDPRSDRQYISMDNALGIKRSTPKANKGEKTHEHADALAAALADFMDDKITSDELSALKRRAESGLPLEEPKNDSGILAIRNKKDPRAVRVLSPNQIQRGVGVEGLIGKGKLDDWEIGRVPEGTKSNTKRASDLFSVSESAPAKKETSPLDMHVKTDDLKEVRITTTDFISPNDRDFLINLLKDHQPTSDVDYSIMHNLRIVLSRQDVSGAELIEFYDGLQAIGWPKSVDEIRKLSAFMGKMADTVNKATNGRPVLRPVETRAENIKFMVEGLNGFSAENIAETVNLLERVLKKHGIAPILGDETPHGTLGNADTKSNTIQIGNESVFKDRLYNGKYASEHRQVVIIHELAHWAYKNILNPSDHAEFWKATEKFYGQQGAELEGVRDRLPYGRDETHPFSPTNQFDSPQEYFANQMVAYVLGTNPNNILNENFYNKVVRIMKNLVIGAYFKKAIDPDLEPLFAKILPDDADVVKHAEPPHTPTTKMGRAVLRRYHELTDLEDQMTEMIRGGNSEAILYTAKDIADTYMSLVRTTREQAAAATREAAAKGSEARQRAKGGGSFAPLRPMAKMMRDKADAIYEILKDADQGYDDAGSVYEYEEAAAKMVNLFTSGSGGKDSYGVFDTNVLARAKLEETYRHFEKAPIDARIHGTPNSLRPPKDINVDTYSNENVKRRKADKKKARRLEKKTESDAQRRISTPKNKRSGLEKMLPDEPELVDNIPRLTKADLYESYNLARGTQLEDALAYEIVRRIKAEPYKAKNVPEEYISMGGKELERTLLDGITESDPKKVKYAMSEINRRHSKASAKKAGGDITPYLPKIIKNRKVKDLILKEVDSNTSGLSLTPGLPANTRFSVREFSQAMTHREPEKYASLQNMAYRLLSFNNKIEQGEQSLPITNADVTRLSRSPKTILDAATTFTDFRGSEFNSFRNSLRKIVKGISEDATNTDDIIDEVNHLVLQTDLIDENELNDIIKAYRDTNDITKHSVKENSNYKNFPASRAEPLMATEWFAKRLTKAQSGQIKIKSELYRPDGAAKHQRRLYDIAQKVNEGAGYLLNGHIKNENIKANYANHGLGDLFYTKPRHGRLSREVVFAPDDLDYKIKETLDTIHPQRLGRMIDFTNRSPYSMEPDGTPKVFYHGTPHVDPLLEPDTVIRLIQSNNNRQMWGDGFYITASTDAATFYADFPTEGAMKAALKKAVDSGIVDNQFVDYYNDTLTQLSASKNILKQFIAEDKLNEISGNVKSGTDKKQIISTLMSNIAEYEQKIMEMNMHLAKHDLGVNSGVVPVITKITNPADFRSTNSYTINTPIVQSLFDGLVDLGALTPKEVRQAEDWLSTFGAEFAGDRPYQAAVEVLRESRGYEDIEARNIVNTILGELGFDSIRMIHRNAGIMSDTNPRGAHDSYVIIPHSDLATGGQIDIGEKVRHINARFEDEFSDVFFATGAADKNINLTGGMARQYINSEGRPSAQPFTNIAEELEKLGVSPDMINTLSSMHKGKAPTNSELRTIYEATNVDRLLSANSDRMKKAGMNWIGDWYKNHFVKHHSDLGRKIVPVIQKMHKTLPDYKTGISRWAEKSNPFHKSAQPDSMKRIVSALRRSPGSRQESNLSAAESAIYTDIKTLFKNELKAMREAGVLVGNIENYFPQVWNADKIKENKPAFIAALADYFSVEAKREGRPIDNIRSMNEAERVYSRLVEEEGLYIPPPIGSTRQPQSDHVDYQRLIRLDQHPDQLQKLEQYLEDDLEFLLTKYFEGTTRRILHTEKFGALNHGFYDYMRVAESGTDGVAYLLSHNRVFRKDLKTVDPDSGDVETMRFQDETVMPFNPDNIVKAREAANQALEVLNTSGEDAALKYLMALSSSRKPSETYRKRMVAIVNGLKDFRGQPNSVNAEAVSHAEASMRVAMRKPVESKSTVLHGEAMDKFSRFSRAFSAVSLLSYTVLTSLPDVVLPLIRSGSFNSWQKGMVKYAADPEYREMIKRTGVAIENLLHDRQVGMFGGDIKGHLGRVQSAFFNATLLTPWTDLQRSISASVGLEAFRAMQTKAIRNHQAGAPIGAQNRQYKIAARFLKHYGLDEYLNGNKSLDFDDVIENDDAVREAMIQFANESIFAPNPNDIPLWAQTPIGAMLFQLKAFPLMMARMSAHAVREFKQGNFSQLAWLATLAPAAGAGSLAVKDILQSRGGEDNTEPALRVRNKNQFLQLLGYDPELHGSDENDFVGWWFEGMMAAGGFGLLGEIMHDIATNADNGAFGAQRIAGTVLGPSFGLYMNSGLNVLGGAIEQGQQMVSGEGSSNAKQRQAVREVAGRVPLVGGNRGLREKIVDTVAGESTSDSGGGGFGSGFGSTFGE